MSIPRNSLVSIERVEVGVIELLLSLRDSHLQELYLTSVYVSRHFRPLFEKTAVIVNTARWLKGQPDICANTLRLADEDLQIQLIDNNDECI